MLKRLLSSAGLVASWLALSGFAAQVAFPWWLALIIVIVILILLWWWLGQSKEEAAPPAKAAPAPDIAASVTPDNLAKIEGIGPKVAGILQAAGFQTFAQLADADVAKLDELLDANKLQMMNPATWPQQAKLAAEGKWEELQIMQDNLKGGQ